MIKKYIKFFLYTIYIVLTQKLDFRHYWILSRKYPIPIFSIKPGLQGNHCYGNSYAVQNAMGTDYDTNCMIEHGVYFGRKVIEEECLYQEISTIYTYSPYREEVLREHFGKNLKKKIVPIGPYIIYAHHMLHEADLIKLKRKWGRTLLVFPSHSSPEGEQSFDYQTWFDAIKAKSKDYDTVIISLFWLDIYNGNYKHYLKKGFIIVCCGNRFDPHFLSRQKDLISIADMTMSNDIGTHIGYCIALGKPHYIYRQEIKWSISKSKDKDTSCIALCRQKEYDELFNMFGMWQEYITKEQIETVKYYWGNF